MKLPVLLATAFAALAPIHAYAAPPTTIQFKMVASSPTCLPNAWAVVTDHSFGEFENLEVVVYGLPPKTGFDLFSLEVPGKPFGMGWYIGDIETDDTGTGVGNFVGRFNIETFVVSPGVPTGPNSAPPNVFHSPPAAVPEATVGITTNPIQLYHLGLWFNSPADAKKACGVATATPFNGEHNAGIQVLNTHTFPDNKGPLINLQ